MSIETVKGLAAQFKDLAELQSYCNRQFSIIQQQSDKIKELQAEVTHLRGLVEATLPNYQGKVEEIIVPIEQQICQIEIDRLRKTAIERGLTLEETKRLDLLVKNLYLSKGVKTGNGEDYGKLPPGMSEAQLIHIASNPVPKRDDIQ